MISGLDVPAEEDKRVIYGSFEVIDIGKREKHVKKAMESK